MQSTRNGVNSIGEKNFITVEIRAASISSFTEEACKGGIPAMVRHAIKKK